ncbi:zinc finger bed domain-containing protein 1-like protein [Lasius niger]|uniref:Zinc finger bed domain-containing protein 1-like protein n=1 Tax=Lasius niger TaxID=67767 RepID=A0A0J7KSL2_LASNI|nr:zinc finger bed domain-containing protein 1-like protein [Lasius niger]
MSNTSELMKHFKKIDNSTMSCNLCDKHIKTSGNSSLATMANHINSHSNKNRLNSNKINNNASHTLETPTKSMRLKRSQLTQMNMSSAAAAPARMSSYSNDEDAKILNAILYYMCIDDKPFNTIHCKGFKYLMKELAPNCKIPSEKTIKRRLDEKYDVIVKIFKQQLNETLHVTISIDTWSEAVSCKSFLRVTVHFIASGKDSKKLESGNIELIELSEYTVDYIASALSNALKTWCIDISKVVAVITNHESNIVKAVTQIFGQYKHITCFAHTINLVAKNSMKNCEGLSDIIDKVRLVVKFIKNSTDINNELHQRQVDLGTSKTEIKKLILDIDLRWNSTFYMIERFIELWTVIYVLLINHKTPDIKVPTDDELNMLKEIVVLLRPLAFMAKECSAENYIVISKIIPLINCALIEYKKTTQMMELSMKLKETILKELQSRFGQIEFSHSFSIATILDPRFKIIHFQNTQALANAMY